jgi:soluble lytic murein transglycosylase-like protein
VPSGPAARLARLAGLAALICSLAQAARADQQRDPELKELLRDVAAQPDCFVDRFESEVWHKTMEPRLSRLVSAREARMTILDTVYCEAKRDPALQLPPDLVLALIDVESRFDNWAVSAAGAVGLMQVMPFWPRQLGVENQLVRIGPNIRIGCEILRFYLRAEHHDWVRALARYNGSVGRNSYPAMVMQRWQRIWRF